MIIERKKYLEKIEKSVANMPITVLIGARQVGKTTLLESYKTELPVFKLDGQLPDTNNLFANINDVISFLKIKINEQVKGLLIIDEFQMINKISSSLKILADTYKQLKILCSGSSSLDIIQKVEESLAGRVRLIYVNSLSLPENILFSSKSLFDEYEKYSISTNDSIISPQIKQLLNQQLTYGGMPRVCLTNQPQEKIQTLDDIYKTYLMRDVKSYVRNADSVGFNKLIRLLALQIGNLMNVNELSRTSGLSYNKCEEYIYLLEQMFIIKTIEPYETNKRKAIKKMKKIYFLDLGIRNIIVQNFNTPEFRLDAGAIFENFVFLELIKSTENYHTIQFFRSRDGAEVDFILNNMIEKISFEVKYSKLKKTKKYVSLQNFNKTEGIKKSYIINLKLNTQTDKETYLPACLITKIFRPS